MKTGEQLAELYERLGPPEWTNFALRDLRAEATHRVGAFVLADHDGRVVLIRRAPIKAYPGIEDYWWIPGGGQEGDERIDQTARREFAEETGLTVSILRILLAQLSDDSSFIAVTFRGRVVNGNVSSEGDPDRITEEAREFSPGQVPFDRLWMDQDKILLVGEGFVMGNVEGLIEKQRLRRRYPDVTKKR